MQTKVRVAIVAVFALAGSVAMAGGDKPEGQPTKPISIEELQARCLNPGQFEQQHAPQNITIQCTDTQTSWVAGAPGEVSLDSSRQVTTAIFSDKWHVDAKTDNVAIQGKAGTCLRFKEVQATFTVEQKLTCDEILGRKEGITDFCASVLDRSKHENPKLIEMSDTGNLIDNCPQVESKPGDGKPGDGKPGDGKPGNPKPLRF